MSSAASDELVEHVAKAIAYEHCNRKQWRGYVSKDERCKYYAEHEWKTFVPAAYAALRAIVDLQKAKA